MRRNGLKQGRLQSRQRPQGKYGPRIAYVGMCALLITALCGNVYSESTQYGTLAGTVENAATNERLVGATIALVGTQKGMVCNFDGEFNLMYIPVGVYDVRISMMGYTPTIVKHVEIKKNETTSITVQLADETVKIDAVVVEARMVENNEGAMLRIRKNATGVTDAVSAEAMSRTGSSNAASAMKRVTGASVVDGNNIVIRGLGARYSSSSLNGMALPSANPDRQTAPLDLIGASALKNITVQKTFTPDRPGNFTGGSVDIQTRDYPDARILTFSASSSLNTRTSFSNDFLQYAGSPTDWLGIDDGTRALPGELQNGQSSIPSIGTALSNPDSAAALDRISRSFNSDMSAAPAKAPLNQSYTLTFGDKVKVAERPLGALFTANYKRNVKSYDNGITGRWVNTGNVSSVTELNNDFLLKDTKSTDNINWGGSGVLSYDAGSGTVFKANLMYNRGAEITSRYLIGSLPRDLSDNQTFETRALLFTERELYSGQFSAEHEFHLISNARLNWMVGYANSTQNDPDLRFFSDDFRYVARRDTTVYSISPSIYPSPSHYFRNLNEDTRNAQVDLSFPFSRKGHSGELKVGVSGLAKDRTFRERRFDYNALGSSWGYSGDPNSYFVSAVGDTSGDGRFGLYISDATDLRNSYDGTQEIYAGYAMLKVPVTSQLLATVGARVETTDMSTVSLDENVPSGSLNETDALPSVNLTYNAGENTSFRLAYGKTLARPSLREMAPFPSFEFINDYILNGNANLRRTLIDNYDARWEVYSGHGELISVSGFYKRFTDPIEKTIVDPNGQVQFVNVDNARVYGVELEFRKSLGWISPKLANVSVNSNVTLLNSAVDIDSLELALIRGSDPGASAQRPLQGQSNYIINAMMSYNSLTSGSSVSAMFNVFGRRLSKVSIGATPDIYERPFASLDMTFSQNLFGRISIKGAGTNLLNSKFTEELTFKGRDYIAQQYGLGSTFSFGVKYSLN